MPTDHSGDRFGEPWSDATYRGFAGHPGDRPRRFRMPRISRRQLAIGAAGAVALGLLLGLWARPNLGASHDTDAAERAAPAVPIEVNRPPPPRPLVSNGKLEVLPPDMAAANRPVAPSAATPAPMPAQTPAPPSGAAAAASLAPPPPAPAGPTVIRGNPPPMAAQTPTARPRPDGAACAGGGAADQLVCADPELAGADREMRRAYRRALAAGAAPAALRADQRDWLAIREDAARHSRQALAQVYDQRIQELNAAAADRDGAQDSPDF